VAVFWTWFILTGIIGSMLLRKKIPRWRESIPDDGLKGLTLVGLFFFLVMGVFGLVKQSDSAFWPLVTSIVSWTGLISAVEQLKRLGIRSTSSAGQDMESPQPAETLTGSSQPRRIKGGQRQVWPPSAMKAAGTKAPAGFDRIFSPSLTESEVDSIAAAQFSPPAFSVESTPVHTAEAVRHGDRALQSARSRLLAVLNRCPAANPDEVDYSAEEIIPDILGKTFLTPIESRFGSGATSVLSSPVPLSAPLRSRDMTTSDDTDADKKYQYVPKLIDSKFKK